jgi:LacI family transcriptional regulator, galactose operon repressor
MPSRRPTVSMKDVAALAGVSVGTVSNVLNSPALVSDATRARVEKAIAKLGWVRNESARQLRAGRSRSIGMVVMDVANPVFTDIVSGVEDYVHDRGYSVQLGNSAQQVEREAAHLRLFEQHRVRGLLLAPIKDVGQQVVELRRHGIPVVIVDRAGEDAPYCSVAVDDVEGGRARSRSSCWPGPPHHRVRWRAHDDPTSSESSLRCTDRTLSARGLRPAHDDPNSAARHRLRHRGG